MELCHYIPSCPLFFLPSLVSQKLSWACFVEGGWHCHNLPRPCVFFHSGRLYPIFHFQSRLFTSASILCQSITPASVPTSCTLMERTTGYLVMRESCSLQSQAALIKLLLCGNRKHSGQPLTVCLPASPLCVIKKGALLFFTTACLSACQTCTLHVMQDPLTWPCTTSYPHRRTWPMCVRCFTDTQLLCACVSVNYLHYVSVSILAYTVHCIPIHFLSVVTGCSFKYFHRTVIHMSAGHNQLKTKG